LKKIFSILLCLAMLVSLAALTATPVSAASVTVLPQLSPASGTYDLSNPSGVATTIIWGNATSVTGVEVAGGAPLGAGDYVVYGNLLAFNDTFLGSVLTDCGDNVILEVEFDVGSAFFTITATGKNASLAPTSRQWVLHSADSANTTITWGDVGNNITSIAFKEISGKTWLSSPGDYVVVDNGDGTGNLSITNSFLAAELLTLGSSVKLDIDMDMCANVTFTVTCVASAAPSISPAKINYCIGCCQNVSTEIDWGDAPVGQIVSIEDVTTATVPLPLYTGMEYVSDVLLGGLYGHWTSDYWLDSDKDTLILNGCESWSANATHVYIVTSGAVNASLWGGLACSLDAGLRQANLIQITFNDTCHTQVILEIDSACITPPSITPSEIAWDLDAVLADITGSVTTYAGAVVSLGTATGIDHIEDLRTGDDLVMNVQWMQVYSPAYGGQLLLFLRDYYLMIDDATAVFIGGLIGEPMTTGANLTSIGASADLLVFWNGGPYPGCDCALCSLFPYFYLPTEVTITATGAGATISPTKADFNLDSPADVTTVVTWGNWATNVTAVMNGATSVPYTLSGDDLTIGASYLSSVLSAVGDQVVLTVKFDQGDSAKLTVTAVGTPLCFIATAAGANAPQLDTLRGFRDVVMRPNALGAKLISLYYAVSPPIAQFISQNNVLREVVKGGLVDPLAALLGAL
jgi:hypothetical protein